MKAQTSDKEAVTGLERIDVEASTDSDIVSHLILVEEALDYKSIRTNDDIREDGGKH